MRGLELARRFYETYGAPMLREQFAAFEEVIAVGLCGSGSECFGYDDDVSTDHDFEPGFCLFLPGEDVIDRRTAFLLERAYAKLPKELEGFTRSLMNPVGGNRHGVLRMDEFFLSKVGSPDGSLTAAQWLTTPEFYLAEVTNGAVFRDDCGAFTAIREKLAYLPEDVRKKKLAGELLTMAQSGQYNYNRCLRHGETGAAQLAAIEFVRAAIHTVFLLNKAYLPYYKWQFRALRELPELSELAQPLYFLISTGNSADEMMDKYAGIENIASAVIGKLQEQGITEATCGDLSKHANSVNDHVLSPALRNEDLFFGV